MRRLLLTLAASAAFAVPALAQTLMTCGASTGHAFYFEGPLVSAGDSGWMEDGLSNGQVTLVRDGKGMDIIFSDAIGMMSARADGARVIVLKDAPDMFVVLVVHRVGGTGPTGATEIYQFNRVNREVLWSQHKFSGNLIDKAALFRAECDPAR